MKITFSSSRAFFVAVALVFAAKDAALRVVAFDHIVGFLRAVSAAVPGRFIVGFQNKVPIVEWLAPVAAQRSRTMDFAVFVFGPLAVVIDDADAQVMRPQLKRCTGFVRRGTAHISTPKKVVRVRGRRPHGIGRAVK